MKNNKQSMAIILIIVAMILVAATIFFMRRGGGDEGADPISSSSNPSSSVSSGTELPSIPSTNIPDVNPSQTSPEKPYDKVDWAGMSETVLSEDEILREVKSILDGLIKMEPTAIEMVSKRSTGGEHNPFRVMLDAVSADASMLAAFRNIGSASSYDVLNIEKSSTNAYTVTIACTTPYMANYAAMYSATDQIVQLEEITLFRANGAAQAIAEMNMNDIPKNTDIVSLAIVVEDDVPVLYHANSYMYGNNSPQYAFLWGSIDFQGTKSGDLMLQNHFGAATVMERNEFKQSKQGTLIVQYLEEALGTIKSANIDKISALTVGGDDFVTHWGLKNTYREYQSLFKKYPTLEDDVVSRLKSLEFTITPYRLTEKQTGAEIYAIVTTYSVLDPMTGSRINNTRFYHVNKSSLSSLNANDGAFINDMLDQIFEDALGGDSTTVLERLRLAGLWNGEV